MTPLITKEQVKKFNPKLPTNISDDEINGYILDCQQFDVISVLPDALLNAIEVQILLKIQQWKRTEAYSIGEAVWFGDSRKYYLADAVNTDSQPPSVNWEAFELMNFYYEYLLPLMAFGAYYRFIAYHGTNITQFGLTTPIDPQGTFQPTSSQDRAAMLGDINNKKNVWTLKISKKLNAVNYTFDAVKYPGDDCESSAIKIKPQIFQLGGRGNTKRTWSDSINRFE